MKKLFVFLASAFVHFIVLSGWSAQAQGPGPGGPPRISQDPGYMNPLLSPPAIRGGGPVYQIPILAALGFQQPDIDRLVTYATPGEIVVLGEPSPVQCSQMQQLQAAGILVGGYVDCASRKARNACFDADFSHDTLRRPRS